MGVPAPGRFRSGQTGQTVNLLAYAFSGSNPLLPMFSPSFHVLCARLLGGFRVRPRGGLCLAGNAASPIPFLASKGRAPAAGAEKRKGWDSNPR